MSRVAEPMMGTEGGRTTGFFFEAWHDWDSFLPGINWRDFCLAHLGGEWSAYTGRVEFEVCLFGLWAKLTYVYDDTFAREMMGLREDYISQSTNPPDAEPEVGRSTGYAQ